MVAANTGRKGAIGATRRVGRVLLRLSFSLGALPLVWAFPKLALAGEPTATVLVYNHANVARSILAAAEREAGRILDGAGVRIIWLECPVAPTSDSREEPCLRKLKSTDIMLRVLPRPARHRLKADVFGFAISPILASVYYDYALRLAVEETYLDFDARIILGCVIAHELGHLFLGSNSHSSAGIMRSRWGQKQLQQALMGTLLFTAEQGKGMQAQVRARTRPQRNGRWRSSRPDS
ncbi:MAG TPA: hypothetical protein VF749_06575 [Candidatus Acidoferrum sp.]